MKIYAARQGKDKVSILKQVQGDDLWIEVEFTRTPDHWRIPCSNEYGYIRVKYLANANTIVTANMINSSFVERNTEFDTRGQVSQGNWELLLHLLNTTTLDIHIEDFEVVQPLECYTTDELLTAIKRHSNLPE